MSMIITQSLTQLPILAEFKQELEKVYQDRLVKLILFGSQARGDADETSDIDVMVILKNLLFPEQEIVKMADIAVTLELKYQQMLSLFPISEEDYLHRKTSLIDNIHREGMII
jgi:predicted nucleotidyltransferase